MHKLDALDTALTRLAETYTSVASKYNAGAYVGVTPLATARGELAQAHGSVGKLQCTGIDAILTSDLTTGKSDAKEKRKALTRRAETLMDEIERLIKTIDAATADAKAAAAVQ
jgi:hypothetical protein